MKVTIIKNSNMPDLAEFMMDEQGERLLFNSHDEADSWLMDNAERGTVYTQFDGDYVGTMRYNA